MEVALIYRLSLFAPNGQRVRPLAKEWVARMDPCSMYEVRAWLGAMRINLASLLSPDEPYFLLVVQDDTARPAHVLGVGRDWPHTVFDGVGLAARAGLTTTKRIVTQTKETRR